MQITPSEALRSQLCHAVFAVAHAMYLMGDALKGRRPYLGLDCKRWSVVLKGVLTDKPNSAKTSITDKAEDGCRAATLIASEIRAYGTEGSGQILPKQVRRYAKEALHFLIAIVKRYAKVLGRALCKKLADAIKAIRDALNWLYGEIKRIVVNGFYRYGQPTSITYRQEMFSELFMLPNYGCIDGPG